MKISSRTIDGRKRGRWTLLVSAGLACAAWATACGDDAVAPSPPPPPEPARPTSIAVEPSSATLTSLGETAVFRATVKDQRGAAFSGTVTWSSSDEAVFTVDAGGRATAVANGSGTVTATLQSLSATAAVQVAQEAASLETVSGDGQAARPGAVLPEPVVVQAVDAGGSPVEGLTVVFAAGEGHGTADPAEAVTDTAGLARTLWTLGDAAGAQTLAASVTDGPSAEVAARGLTAVEIVHDIEVVSGAGQTADLGAALDDSVIVRAVDAEGAPVEGAAVVFTPGEGHGTVDPAEAVTDSEGFARTAWTLGKAVGEQTLVATAGDVSETILAHTINPDRAALEVLYRATDGPNWTNSENWLTDAPLEDWYGVDTDATGRVSRLVLRENGLLGTIPPDLGNLANLTLLRLSLNLLWGAIPAELGSLAFLTGLDLSDNDLSGEIPSEFAGLAKLRGLILKRNQLTGGIPPELGNLRELETLDLYRNQLTGAIPAELGNVHRLRRLSLVVNELTGRIPVELANLTELQDLALGSNDLTGPIPPELASLDNLESLSLWGNNLSGSIPPELASLGNLTSLSLSDNNLTGPIPAELGSLTKLTHLTLGGNRLTGAIPHSFLRLTALGSFGCATSDGVCLPATADFREWEQMVEARSAGSFHVDVPWCDEIDRRALEELFDAAGGQKWAEADGWLEEEALADWQGVATDSVGRVSGLDLTANGLSGHLPAALGQLAGLTELRIANNALSGRLPLSLASLALDEFDYGGTSLCVVDDTGFREWLNRIPRHVGTGVECPPLTDREILELLHRNTGGQHWNQSAGWLTDTPLAAWYGVETDDAGRVVALRLRDNGLSGPIPVELAQLSHLGELLLSRNRLSGSIPLELGNLDRLEDLDLNNNRLSGNIPSSLGQLSRLTSLNLSANRLVGSVPPELGKLDRLESLRLGWNALQGSIPPELGDLANLTYLSLAGNSLSGPVPSALGGLSRLELANLARNRLTGFIPAEFADLGAVRSLRLGDNQLTGLIPPRFGALATLWELDLSNNALTGPIPPELGRLSRLTWLNLGENRLSGPLPAALAGAADLQSLDLRSNALAGPIPPEFANLKLLESLVLANNPDLAGPLPAGMRALNQLEQFMAGGTGLCLPHDAAFDAWFGAITDRLLARCREGFAVYLTQTVQSRDYPVPLLAGEPALLRVFVTATRGGTAATMPDVKVTFYVDGDERHSARIAGGAYPIPPQVVEEDLTRSANAEIPAEVIVPGLEMVIEVDPDGTLDPALGVTTRIPVSGRMGVDVRAVPEFELTLIPFLWEGYADSTAARAVTEMAEDAAGGHESFREVRGLLPIAGLAIKAHDPVSMSHSNPSELLAQIEAMRLMEGGSGYWLGVVATKPGARFHWFPGMARLPGHVSYARPHAASTMAHELGHNLGLWHAPCGGAGTPDPWFPSPTGRIGAWGYDFARSILVDPVTPDLMSYCGPPDWISDYHFNKALGHRLSIDAQMAAAVAGPTQTLLLWGGRDTVGIPYLDPAFVVDAVPALPPAGTEYTIEGTTADGTPLFSYSFDMPATADAEGEETSFVFALPVQAGWADDLANITLSGPGGLVALDNGTDRPMAILRDPQTGQVRGFLSDMQVEDFARTAAAGATVGSPPLDVLISSGIPDAEAWRR